MKAFAAIDSTGLAANALSAGLIARLPDTSKFESMLSSTKGPTEIKVEKTGATGGLVTTKSAGIFQLHQGEMVMDNAAVAAFQKSLNLMNMSQENALAGVGGGGTVVVNNNNNVDNSMRSSQSTSVSVPEATRTNESTLRALQMA